MRNSAAWVLLVLSMMYLKTCSSNSTALQLSPNQDQSVTIQEVGRKLKNLWEWVQVQSKSEDTFVGRCAGAFKKMKMAMNFIIFKLGVIVTALVFLSVLAFKSVGIGVVILILTSVGLVTKFLSLKHEGGHHKPVPPAVHLHVYKGGHSGGGGHYYSHSPSGSDWYDRLGSDRDGIAKNSLERSAIADLYKRLGITDELYGWSYGDSDRRFSIR